LTFPGSLRDDGSRIAVGLTTAELLWQAPEKSAMAKSEPGVWKEKDGRRNCWRARVEYKGHKLEDSFAKQADANKFVRTNKTSIDNNDQPANIKELRGVYLEDVFKDRIKEIDRQIYAEYIKTQAAKIDKAFYGINKVIDEEPSKRYASDKDTLNRLLRDPIAKMRVLAFKRKHVKEFIARRLGTPWAGPNGDWSESKRKMPAVTTVRRDIAVMHKAFEDFRDTYDHVQNPFSKIGTIEGKQHSRKPRSLEPGELELLLKACEGCMGYNKFYMPVAIYLAYELGMRRQEILNLCIGDIKDGTYEGTLEIRRSKTDWKQDDPGRTIPLTKNVERALDKLQNHVMPRDVRPEPGYPLFWDAKTRSVVETHNFENAWKGIRARAVKMANAEGRVFKPFAFHDLRTTAITRFDKILVPTQIRMIVGHFDAEDADGHTKTTRAYVKPSHADLMEIKDKLDAYAELEAKGAIDPSEFTVIEFIQRIAR
jgi:integrase